ncbi:MAG TPA: hypothetical protein VN936_04225, partial [Candidatus Acidoferrum sp.]|nr:hypothetical protein [Candidatus Acidoferrum sp.]
VQHAARELFELVRAVARAIQPSSEMPVVLHGGVVRTPNTLTYLLETHLTNELPALHTVRAKVTAHDAALRMAEAFAT